MAANESQPITAALQPSASAIKRLSTISKSSAPDSIKGKNGQSGPLTTAVSTGAIKDVVSPGELCGFVSGVI